MRACSCSAFSSLVSGYLPPVLSTCQDLGENTTVPTHEFLKQQVVPGQPSGRQKGMMDWS